MASVREMMIWSYDYLYKCFIANTGRDPDVFKVEYVATLPNEDLAAHYFQLMRHVEWSECAEDSDDESVSLYSESEAEFTDSDEEYFPCEPEDME